MAQPKDREMAHTGYPRYGEVFEVSLEPVVGSEIGKRRPAIIVSNDQSNQYADTITVVPLTGQSGRRQYPFNVLIPRGIGGLSVNSRTVTRYGPWTSPVW